MPFYKDSLDGTKNRWRANLSRAMKQRAKRTRCPKCKRKNALRRISFGDGSSCRVCRWQDCGYELSP